MAHSTAIPAAPQSPRASSDWYSLLRSAFINGLKAYGASLMTVVPHDHAESPAIAAPPKSAPRNQPITRTQAAPALSCTPMPKPAWSRS